jgi:hypothetical protein
MSLLRSELGQVRHEIQQTADYGYDTMVFNFEPGFIIKVYLVCIFVLFVGIGAYEETTGGNTTLNKWFRA